MTDTLLLHITNGIFERSQQPLATRIAEGNSGARATYAERHSRRPTSHLPQKSVQEMTVVKAITAASLMIIIL